MRYRKVKMEPSGNKIPKHIGIIMDGNRRFAKRLMLKPWQGHEMGAGKVEKVLNWCKELGIPEVTLYAFSLENFNRPKEEFDFLMRVFKQELERLLHDDKKTKDIRINFMGRTHLFNPELQEIIKQITNKTAHNSPYCVNFAMAYSGRAEIIDAMKKIADLVHHGKLAVSDITEDLVANNLYLSSEPDLIIRTSGERRISGFLLWQGSYAELYFCDKLWPEFEKEDLVKAVTDYGERERRFGR